LLLIFITIMPLRLNRDSLSATWPILLYWVPGVNGLVLLKKVIVSCASATATVALEVRRPDNMTFAFALTWKLPRISTWL
jgi:hypothetical protein